MLDKACEGCRSCPHMLDKACEGVGAAQICLTRCVRV